MIILSAQNIAKAFGVNTVLRDVSLTVQQGDRIGLVGVNGCGKSTLMRILAGLDAQDSGEISLVRGTRVGYLAQQNMVTSGETVWNELQKVYEPVFVMEKKLRELEDEMAHAHTDEQRFARLSSDYDRLIQRFEEADGYAWKSMVSGVLNGLGFKPTQYDQCVDSLSGGEQTRLCLARLLLQKPDLLLLDEPTNHLDMETLQWLENYLSAYKGSVLVISHDRYFLDHVCTGIVEILKGRSALNPACAPMKFSKRKSSVSRQSSPATACSTAKNPSVPQKAAKKRLIVWKNWKNLWMSAQSVFPLRHADERAKMCFSSAN